MLPGTALLERLQELFDLLNAEPPLPAGGAVGLEVAHIRPTADSAERNPKRIGGLRSGQTEGTVPHLFHTFHFRGICERWDAMFSNCTTFRRKRVDKRG